VAAGRPPRSMNWTSQRDSRLCQGSEESERLPTCETHRDKEVEAILGRVTFYPDFWMVSGTAAPVIALAAVVAFRDAFVTMGEILHLGYGASLTQLLLGSDKSPAGLAWANAVASGSLALYNCLAQTAALALSLISLADRANATPYAVVIVIECTGILALFAGVFAGLSGAWRTRYTLGKDDHCPRKCHCRGYSC
jgi:hypothetical protein